jgi:hypothetical protein
MRTPATHRTFAVRGLAVAGAAALGLALAACNGEEAEPGAEDPTAPPADGAAQVADCVVGDWRSASVDGEIGGAVVDGTLIGGSGVFLTVNSDGGTRVVFSDMEPLAFDGELAGVDVSGEVVYRGIASGTIRTDLDVTSGSWGPAGEIDWSDVRVTADVTEPVEGRPLDDTPLGEVLERADEVTGGVVDVDPVLGEGRFECQDETLIVRSSGDANLSWTFLRA